MTNALAEHRAIGLAGPSPRLRRRAEYSTDEPGDESLRVVVDVVRRRDRVHNHVIVFFYRFAVLVDPLADDRESFLDRLLRLHEFSNHIVDSFALIKWHGAPTPWAGK